MEIKHFVDIENLRETDVDVGNGIIRGRNDQAFEVGDIISITEKVDGSNASIRYDVETDTLASFSRRQPLTPMATLNGFYNYAQKLDASIYKDTPNYSIFGEWLIKHKIKYNPEHMNKWYVYSIYDNENKVWLSQDEVKAFVKAHNLTYVHELYVGPFISWEHCRSFAHSPLYGDTQEGVVVRNLTKLADKNCRYPHILKIVNTEFAESMKHSVKEIDPVKEAEKAKAQELINSIVTRNRIEKLIFKMQEDGIIPTVFAPTDMRIVAQNLPKLAYADCMKEEPEIMIACGEYAGKMCSSVTMQHAKAILLG